MLGKLISTFVNLMMTGTTTKSLASETRGGSYRGPEGIYTMFSRREKGKKMMEKLFFLYLVRRKGGKGK